MGILPSALQYENRWLSSGYLWLYYRGSSQKCQVAYSGLEHPAALQLPDKLAVSYPGLKQMETYSPIDDKNTAQLGRNFAKAELAASCG